MGYCAIMCQYREADVSLPIFTYLLTSYFITFYFAVMCVLVPWMHWGPPMEFRGQSPGVSS